MWPLWDLPDAEAAENQLRGLDRRLSELEKALEACGDILLTDENDFAAGIAASHLNYMQERLLKERAEILKFRINEHIQIIFSGDNFARSSAEIEQFGSFLFRFQRFFQSVAQSVTSGPTPRGPISEQTKSLSTLRLANTFASSFGMDLFVPSSHDLFGRSTAVRTLRIIFSLLADAENPDLLLSFSGELGSRASSHFKKLARDLKKSDGSVTLRWLDQAGIEYSWKADSAKISRIFENTKANIDNQYIEKMYPSILVGASLLKNTFEIMDLESRSILSGHVTQQSWGQLSEMFGKPVLANVITHTSTNSLTGHQNVSHTVTAFEDMTLLPPNSTYRHLLPKRFLTQDV